MSVSRRVLWKNDNAVYRLQISALVPEIFKFKSKAPSSYLMVCGNYCMKCCRLCLVELSTIWKINVYLTSPSNDFTLLSPNRYYRKVFFVFKRVISTAPNFILFQFRSCDDTLRRFFSKVPNSNSNFSFKFKEIHRKMTEWFQVII